MQLAAFAALPLLVGVEDAVIARLYAYALVRRHAESSVLFYEEEETPQLFVLISGRIKVFKTDRFGREIFLYFITEGQMLHESYSPGVRCFSSAVCVEESQVLGLSLPALLEASAASVNLSARLLALQSERIRLLQCVINREVVMDGTARVAHMLLTDTAGFNRYKKNEIAQMLNLQPETLSRILGKLAQDGAIRSQGNTTLVQDEEVLRRIVL